MAPACGFVGAGQHQHVRPAHVNRNPRCAGKNDVTPAAIEISQPPTAVRRLAFENRHHLPIRLGLIRSIFGHHDSCVIIEYRRNPRGDRQADRRPGVDPRDIRCCADLPAATVPNDFLQGSSMNQLPSRPQSTARRLPMTGPPSLVLVATARDGTKGNACALLSARTVHRNTLWH